MEQFPFKAIAAMAENRVIGNGPDIPWHLPEDFKWFKQTTMGNTIVMGRRTYESIGRPLPGRRTIVLSRSEREIEGVAVVATLEDALSHAEGAEVFICGGAEIYELALPQCSDLYLTRVKRSVVGDVLFPVFEDRFREAEEIRDSADFRIVRYRNRALD
jgi:dihydrofolate reductase